jgi:hypothetical protein
LPKMYNRQSLSSWRRLRTTKDRSCSSYRHRKPAPLSHQSRLLRTHGFRSSSSLTRRAVAFYFRPVKAFITMKLL